MLVPTRSTEFEAAARVRVSEGGASARPSCQQDAVSHALEGGQLSALGALTGPEHKEVVADVGILGWLGFIIINVAAWGIIGVSTAIAWPLGFIFCLLYTAVLVGLVKFLDQYGSEYKAFENLLAVLACSFVFILGLYISLNIVGPIFGEQPGGGDFVAGGDGGSIYVDGDLSKLLDAGSSSTLQEWARETDHKAQSTPTFGVLGDYVYFQGMSEDFIDTSASLSSVLLRTRGSDPTDTSRVSPVISSTRCFVQNESVMFFLGREPSGFHERLWTIDESAPGIASDIPLGIIHDAELSSDHVRLRHLIIEEGILYLKAMYHCNDAGDVSTIFSSDGTSAGTTNLRGWVCPKKGDGDSGSVDTDANDVEEKPVAQMWSTIIIGVVPMMASAAWILRSRQLPGMFMNLYLGGGITAFILYAIFVDELDPDLFMKIFVTSYTSLIYAVLTVACLLIPTIPKLLEEMKTWIVLFVGLPFLYIIHMDLEIPGTESVAAWVGYAALAFVQMLISIIVSRTLPMIFGAICLAVVAWKIAYEIVQFIYGDDTIGDVQFLIMLGILAAQGIGIILAAVGYASRREDIDEAVRHSLLRCLRRPVPDPSE